MQEVLQNPIFVKYGLAGLFVNGVLASTAIPLPTEITVSALLSNGTGRLDVFIILAISTFLGGVGGYFLGKSGNKMFRFFKGNNKPGDEEKSHGILRRYGWIAIAGSAWIPVIGDIIPIVAGTKKYDFKIFLAALAVGKVTKAIAVVYFSSFIIGRIFG